MWPVTTCSPKAVDMNTVSAFMKYFADQIFADKRLKNFHFFYFTIDIFSEREVFKANEIQS